MHSEQEIFKDALFRNKKKKKGYRVVEAPCPPLEASVADTHAHLDMLCDVPLVLARCAVHNVGFICSIVDPSEDKGRVYAQMDSWQGEAEALLPEIITATEAETDQHISVAAVPSIRIATGCHPHNAKHYDEALEKKLCDQLRDPRTCAIGEIGLDYHYDFSPRPIQKEVFRRQIHLAHKTQLPIILHLREAHDEAMDIMKQEGFPAAGTLLHCFNLDSETLLPWLEQGCYVAFGGPVTFKKSEDTREASKLVATDRLLTETDAPYMTPEPMRGMVCGPQHTIFTAACLAEVRGCQPGNERETFLAALYANALTLLDRKPTCWQTGE